MKAEPEFALHLARSCRRRSPGTVDAAELLGGDDPGPTLWLVDGPARRRPGARRGGGSVEDDEELLGAGSVYRDRDRTSCVRDARGQAGRGRLRLARSRGERRSGGASIRSAGAARMKPRGASAAPLRRGERSGEAR